MNLGQWIWILFSIGIGNFVTLYAILSARQGAVYIPKRLVLRVFDIDDDDCIVTRNEHPIGFWVLIVALLIQGGLANCFAAGWFLYGQPFTAVT